MLFFKHDRCHFVQIVSVQMIQNATEPYEKKKKNRRVANYADNAFYGFGVRELLLVYVCVLCVCLWQDNAITIIRDWLVQKKWYLRRTR